MINKTNTMEVVTKLNDSEKSVLLQLLKDNAFSHARHYSELIDSELKEYHFNQMKLNINMYKKIERR